MNRYKLTNTLTGEVVEKEAEYLGHAIEAVGWLPDDCICEIVPPKRDGETDTTVAISVIGDPTDAEKVAYEHKQQIETLALGAEVMFLRMGQLFYGARIAGEWSILHFESYREYIEDIKLPMTNSYSWATRLSAIYEYLVKNMKLDEKLLAEIGVAKLTRLLPLARKGELTEDIIEAARIMSDLDLRAELGHNVEGSDDKPDMIICPRCGEVINAKTANRV